MGDWTDSLNGGFAFEDSVFNGVQKLLLVDDFGLL